MNKMVANKDKKSLLRMENVRHTHSRMLLLLYCYLVMYLFLSGVGNF